MEGNVVGRQRSAPALTGCDERPTGTSQGHAATTLTKSHETVAEGSSNRNLANGSGLEHIEEAWGALFGEVLGACAL
jgi:hypothetical protein